MVTTKAHKTAQSMTYPLLSVVQQNAIDLLLTGQSDRAVGDTIGVSRETVWHWRHEHPVFLAELNRRRQALWADAHDRLRALVGQAVDVLDQAVRKGDVKAAVEVLKIVKVHGDVPPPDGPDDPDLVLWQQAERWATLVLRREGPAVDPMRALIDVKIARHVTLAQQRAAELRQQWAGSADHEPSR
jgi:hypothetical protein